MPKLVRLLSGFCRGLDLPQGCRWHSNRQDKRHTLSCLKYKKEMKYVLKRVNIIIKSIRICRLRSLDLQTFCFKRISRFFFSPAAKIPHNQQILLFSCSSVCLEHEPDLDEMVINNFLKILLLRPKRLHNFSRQIMLRWQYL